MLPLDNEWVEELQRQAATDPSFFTMYDHLTEIKPQCTQIIESLPADQRNLLNTYLRLLSRLEVWQTRTAYICGVQVGERRGKK